MPTFRCLLFVFWTLSCRFNRSAFTDWWSCNLWFCGRWTLGEGQECCCTKKSQKLFCQLVTKLCALSVRLFVSLFWIRQTVRSKDFKRKRLNRNHLNYNEHDLLTKDVNYLHDKNHRLEVSKFGVLNIGERKKKNVREIAQTFHKIANLNEGRPSKSKDLN